MASPGRLNTPPPEFGSDGLIRPPLTAPRQKLGAEPFRQAAEPPGTRRRRILATITSGSDPNSPAIRPASSKSHSRSTCSDGPAPMPASLNSLAITRYDLPSAIDFHTSGARSLLRASARACLARALACWHPGRKATGRNALGVPHLIPALLDRGRGRHFMIRTDFETQDSYEATAAST